MDLIRKYYKWALLLAFCIVVFALNLKEPGLYSAQEGRAGIAARNMMRSGDYMSVYIRHAHNTEKPIFCYWLYAASCKLFGLNEVGVRLPSALAAIATVLMTCWLCSRVYGERAGFLSGYILATMAAFVNLARIARHIAFMNEKK